MTAASTSKKGVSKLFIIIILGVIALVIGGVVFIIIGSRSNPPPQPVTLTMWGVWDETSDLAGVIKTYERLHPYVKISYSKKRYEEYEDLLLKAWATNTGPDIYMLPNSWVNAYRQDFITPLPKSTTVSFYRTKKVLFRKETEIKPITEKSLTPNDIKRNFIDVVYDDVIFGNTIYALPFGVNTLVMYYNKELLNIAHLAQPPQTWNDFAAITPNITIADEQNNIIRAGTALGTYDNIPRSSDIVTALMMQNGTAMATGSAVTFQLPSSSDPTYYPGEEALRFYTDFASPEKTTYTWNAQLPNALDFFAEGKVAFFFGYPYQEPEIQTKVRGFEYSIAPLPQINPQNEVNFANYWVYTVSQQVRHVNEAWDFLQFAASEKYVKPYLEQAHQTSVLRSLINEQLSDPDQGLFARQALTAKSWYHGKKPKEAEGYFAEMIKTIANKEVDIRIALAAAAKKIQADYE